MADPVDIVRDAPRMPVPAVDPEARIPDSVKRASALADSYYQKAVEAAPAAPEPAPVAAEPAAPAPAAPPADEPNYEHMYRSMKGRFEQSQHQTAQLAEELRLQQEFIRQLNSKVDAANAPQEPIITEEERKTYGDEFFDVVTRTAANVVATAVEGIKEENEELKRQLQRTANQTLGQLVAAQVPNWREINQDPRFTSWLNLRDVYSGMARLQLLQNAQRRSDAPAIIAFYRNYLAESGQTARPTSDTPPPSAAPREPAVKLESLVAPGRARPASDAPDVPVTKPQYTRQQIAALYAQKRQGLWNSRLDDWNRLETDIIAAGREDRVKG